MRLKHRYAAVLAAFAVFIAGCSNNLVGRMAGDGKTGGTVTFSVTDIPSNYAEMIREAHNPPSASRSILPPSAPFAADTSGLTFVLTGKSNSGKTKEETIGSLSHNPPDYSFKLNLEAYVWDLTLTAYKGAPTDKRKVMEGHCTVDLTMGNAQADFKMSIKGITTPGTVKVTGSVTDTELVCTHYEIGIYNLYTGELVEEYTDVDGSKKTTHAKLDADVPSSAARPFPFTYEHTSPKITLNAGAYEYRMVFYKGPSSDLKPIGSYSDTIVVYPGYDLEQAIGTLDVLNRKPTKPDQLRAYLENNSEDKEQDYYYVKLTWKPARFETNYELLLKTSSDDGTNFPNANEKLYGFQSTNNAAEDFLASAIRHAGSLAYGSDTCTLKLQLGKVYEVSLRAHNYIGDSEWVERMVEGSTPGVVLSGYDHYFEALPTTPTPTPPGKHINRRRIKYDLNGGKLILHADAPTSEDTFTGAYIKYDSYTGAAQPLLEINPSTSSPLPAGANTLTRQSGTPPAAALEWTKWCNPNTGDEVPITPPSSAADIYKHANAFVKADFGFEITGTVTPLPAPQDLPRNKIKLTYNEDISALSPPTPAPQPITEDTTRPGHYPVPKFVGGKTMWITVAFDGLTTSSSEYDNLHCTAYFASGAGLSSKVDLQAVNNVCTFSTGDYTPQSFTLRVMARDTTANQMRSQTYIINLY